MTTPRSNVSAVVVRDKLYAVGGFSGKTFLNTIEYLDPATNEWTMFVPQQDIDLANIEQSLKDVVENGFQKSASTTPPPPEELANGNGVTNGHHYHRNHRQAQSSEDDAEAEEQVMNENRRSSVKIMIKGGGDVLFSNGKLDAEAVDELNGHPRVANDTEVDVESS